MRTSTKVVMDMERGISFRDAVNHRVDGMRERHKLIRGKKIFVNVADQFMYTIKDQKDNYLTDDEDFFIYMENVTFRGNGISEGVYLGRASDGLLDDKCINVTYDRNEGFLRSSSLIRKASLVAIDSASRRIVVINE